MTPPDDPSPVTHCPVCATIIESVHGHATDAAGIEWAQPCGHVLRGEAADPATFFDLLHAVAKVNQPSGVKVAQAQAWAEGHAAGRDYQGDGWNADAHDPAEDNPYLH